MTKRAVQRGRGCTRGRRGLLRSKKKSGAASTELWQGLGGAGIEQLTCSSSCIEAASGSPSATRAIIVSNTIFTGYRGPNTGPAAVDVLPTSSAATAVTPLTEFPKIQLPASPLPAEVAGNKLWCPPLPVRGIGFPPRTATTRTLVPRSLLPSSETSKARCAFLVTGLEYALTLERVWHTN